MPEKPSTPITAATCPECGYRMDAASETFGNRRPRRGDFTFCMRCAHLFVFDGTDDRLSLREPTDAEHAEALADPKVVRVGWGIRKFWQQRHN